MQKTGFYNLREFKREDLREFFTFCLSLADKSNVQHLVRHKREIHPTYTPQDMLDKYLKDNIHVACVDRSVQHKNELYGEIGFSTFCAESLFLYIFVSLENLAVIIKKFDLKEL